MLNDTVVVTGASTGIGEACALQLDRLGFNVLAGVRRDEDGEKLKAQASPRLKPIRLDITDPEHIREAAETVDKEADGRLAGLVNNAGVVVAGPLEFIPIDDVRRQMEINVVAQIAITQSLLPAIRSARGRIVNIGSIAGRLSSPFSGPYSASKFAMEALTDALRVELKPWNIHVVLVEPGNIATPIWQKGIAEGHELRAGLPQEAEELYGNEIDLMFRFAAEQDRRGIPADRVADAVTHALTARRPKTRYLVGNDAKMQAVVARTLPDRVRDKLIQQQLNAFGRSQN